MSASATAHLLCLTRNRRRETVQRALAGTPKGPNVLNNFVTSFGAAFEGTELGSPHLVSAEEKITCHKWWELCSTRLIQMSRHGI